MRLIATLVAAVLFAAPAFSAPPQAPRPPQAPPIIERVEQLEKENADLKARVTILEQGRKAVASVPEFTQICSIDPVTGLKTCRLVRTPKATGCGCENCPCVNGECGSANCPSAGITYPPFGATQGFVSGCANGQCGQSFGGEGFTSGGCASGNCGGGNGAILRVNGGPGLIRGIFGRRCR